MVASEGFEPTKSMTADLQSDPFGRLGNLPCARRKEKEYLILEL